MSKLSDTVRKRLKSEYRKTKSYAIMAEKYGVSKGVLYNFLHRGTIPANVEYQEKMGLIKPKSDKPSAKLLDTRRRRAELNSIAVYWGYENWANYETRVLKDFRERFRDEKFQDD
jgi:transposase